MKKQVPKYIQRRALEMHAELLEHKQEVILVDSEDDECAMRGGKIRLVVDRPPRWFTEFGNMYPKVHRPTTKRRYTRPRTKIARHAVLRALLRLGRGDNSTVYTERLLEFIDRQISNETPF